MKRSCMSALVLMGLLLAAVMPVSCDKYDDSALWDEVDKMNARIDSLTNALNKDLNSLYRLLNSSMEDLQNKVDAMVTVVSVVENSGKITVTLSDNTTIVVNSYSSTPVVTVIEEKGVKYWAMVGVDGKVTPMTDKDGNMIPTTHVNLKFRLDHNTREIMYSVDGGVTWIQSGVIMTADADASIITNVIDNGDTVTFYLGSFSFDVKKAVKEHFAILSGKQYFEPSQSRSIAVSIEGYKSHFVASSPDGWQVSFDGEELVVTAPDGKDPDNQQTSGTIELWVATEDGKLLVGKFSVAVSDAKVVIVNHKVNGKYVAEYIASDAASSEVEQFYYGISRLESFDKEELFSAIESGKYTQDNDGKKSFTLSYAETFGSEPKAGEVFLAWAYIPEYNQSVMTSTKDDFIISYLAPSEVSFQYEAKFNDIDIMLSINGSDSFHAIAMSADMYDPSFFDIQNSINPSFGYVDGYTYDSNRYEGAFSNFGSDPQSGLKNTVLPGRDYIMVVLPFSRYKAITDYVNDDCHVFALKAAKVVAGGSASVNLGNPDEQIKTISVPVSSTGVMTFWQYMTDDELALFSSDEVLAAYLVSPDNEKVVVETSAQFNAKVSVEPDQKLTFVAVAVDADGKYGPAVKQTVKSKEMPAPQFNVEIIESDCIVGANSASIKINVINGTAVKYVYKNSTYEADENIEMDLATSEGVYGYTTVLASDMKDNMIEIKGLNTGETYFFYIMAFDAEGNFSKVGSFIYYTFLDDSIVVFSDRPEWAATRPVVTVWADKDCTESSLVMKDGYMDLYMKAQKNDKVANLYYVYVYESEIAGLSGKELLETLMSKTVTTTKVTSSMWSADGTYVNYYYYYAEADRKFFVYWDDFDGNYYVPFVVEFEYTVGEGSGNEGGNGGVTPRI